MTARTRWLSSLSGYWESRSTATSGGTILLGMAGTLLPILRELQTPPIEAIGLHE